LGANGFYDPRIIEIAGATADGAIFTYPTFDPKSEAPVINNFVKSYSEKFKNEPDAFAVQGYDSMHLLTTSLSGDPEMDGSLSDRISKIENFEGVGGTISFDNEGFVTKPLRIMKIEKGNFVTVDETD